LDRIYLGSLNRGRGTHKAEREFFQHGELTKERGAKGEEAVGEEKRLFGKQSREKKGKKKTQAFDLMRMSF